MQPIHRRLVTGLRLALVAVAVLLIGLLVGPQFTGAEDVRTPAPACANSTVVADPAEHPELVQDCEILLGLRDELAGSATLNWSASLAISDWEGITVDQRNLNAPLRVTALKLRDGRLAGTLPPALGGLSGLRVLWLSHNQLTGSIPPELGNLTTLTELSLAGNQLSGSIPVELAEIGPQLERLDLSGPQPLPSGIGLTGRIPPQLGNLSGLQSLHLEGNRLSGPIPTRLGRLTNLQGLHLQRNQLSGAIPTQLGALTMLDQLKLADNQLVSTIPTQFINMQLQRLYLTGNTITGCLPYWLGPGFLQYGDMARLNLPDCVGVQPETPETPETPLPTYTLTVTVGAGGEVTPSGTSSHDEAVEVVLTASWNDATHTFAGWSGDCAGTATSCALEMYADYTVEASFTELPAGRCATPTEADCIRAVYLGAPNDFAQVQDIPAELLLQPDANGRYPAAPGEQITVVTAAPLPLLHDRFILVVNPLGATTLQQLVQPIGTSYTFTPSGGLAAGEELRFDLRAARSRPGGKPIPGSVFVTTRFERPPEPLTLELGSSRELCTAGTLTELNWTISGGIPPYTLTIDGQTVDPEADSHRANCGPLTMDPQTEEPLPDQTKTFTATVTDSQLAKAAASAINVDLAPALPKPSELYFEPRVGRVDAWWEQVAGAGSQFPEEAFDGYAAPPAEAFLVRWRARDATAWRHTVGKPSRSSDAADDWQRPGPGIFEMQVAAMRHPLEAETPLALNWSDPLIYSEFVAPENVTVSATHDTVTVSWERQPYTGRGYVSVRRGNTESIIRGFGDTTATGRLQVVIPHLPPATDYRVEVVKIAAEASARTVTTVRTEAAPADYVPPTRGPQNVRATATHDRITIRWDEPFAGAESRYLLQVFDKLSGSKVDSRWVYAKPFEYTARGTSGRLRPGATYRIQILHLAIPKIKVVIEATTAPEPPSGGGRSPRSGSLEPWFDLKTLRWPVRIAEHHILTDDPFDWRTYSSGHRYHAGMDLGGIDTGATAVGDPVYAAAAGEIRIFNDGPPNTWGHVFYCPHSSTDFVQQFRTSKTSDGAATTWLGGRAAELRWCFIVLAQWADT